MDLLSKAVPITLLVFVISSLLAVGMSLTLGQILLPLRNPRLVSLSILGNFLLMPVVALAIARVLRLGRSLEGALLLLGTAAGSPLLPKMARIAKSDTAFAVGLMVLLMILTVGYVPLVLPLLLEGVSVDPTKIARSLVLLMLLPLTAGLLVKDRYDKVAKRLAPVLDTISTLSLALMMVLILVTNFSKIVGLFGTRVILASIFFLAAGCSIGWAFGGPAPSTRRVLALGTAQRNIAASLVVGEKDLTDPLIVVMVAVVAIVGVIGLTSLGRALGKQAKRMDECSLRFPDTT
jgi:BASS family bile acid:Na+ symporter